MKPWEIIRGDALSELRKLPDGIALCCVTSPPYFALRSYKAGPQEMGSEADAETYLAAQVAVFREVRRVLRDDGTCWINIGDTYGSERGVCATCGAPYARVVAHEKMVIRRTDWGERAGNRTASSGTQESPAHTITFGWRKTCWHSGEPVGALVLDPYSGTGTTLVAALRLWRRCFYAPCWEAYRVRGIVRDVRHPGGVWWAWN